MGISNGNEMVKIAIREKTNGGLSRQFPEDKIFSDRDVAISVICNHI